MEVIFYNYTNNHIVFTPIVIIKGAFKYIKQSKNDDHYDESKVFDLQNIECKQLCNNIICEIPIKIIKSKFVIIVELKSGENIFNLKYKEKDCIIGTLILNLVMELESPLYTVQGLIVHSSDSDMMSHNDLEIKKLQDKIYLSLQLAQAVFSELLCQEQRNCRTEKQSFQLFNSLQLGSKSIESIKLDLVNNQLKNYTTNDLWQYLARNIRINKSIWSSRKKYVAIVVDNWQSGNKGNDLDLHAVNHMEGLGGGGLALLGKQFLDSWPDKLSDILDSIWNSNGEVTSQSQR